MPENVTPKLRFVISHRKCADGKCERDHCMAVKEVLEDKGIEYVDWEFHRLHIQKESDIIEYGRNCDGVIFLIEGQMGERQEAGYDDILARKANGTPAPETFIYVFTGKNNESSKELLGHLNSKGVVYDEFSSRYALKGHLSDVLKERFPSTPKAPRWPLWVKIIAVAAILSVFLAPLYRPWIKRLKESVLPKTEMPASTDSIPSNEPFVDSARIAFSKRIDTAEVLIRQGKKTQTSRELNRLKEECDKEWEDLISRIDSLLLLIPPKPLPPSPVNVQEVINPKAYVIKAEPSYFRALIVKGLGGEHNTTLMPRIEGEKQRWTITITEDPNISEARKKVDNDPSLIIVDFTVEIQDAKGERRPEPEHIPQSGQGKTRGDAIRAARLDAAPRIATYILEQTKPL